MNEKELFERMSWGEGKTHIPHGLQALLRDLNREIEELKQQLPTPVLKAPPATDEFLARYGFNDLPETVGECLEWLAKNWFTDADHGIRLLTFADGRWLFCLTHHGCACQQFCHRDLPTTAQAAVRWVREQQCKPSATS